MLLSSQSSLLHIVTIVFIISLSSTAITMFLYAYDLGTYIVQSPSHTASDNGWVESGGLCYRPFPYNPMPLQGGESPPYAREIPTPAANGLGS